MLNNDRKLVTIITEAVLEGELCDFLADLGASGYTVTNARGSEIAKQVSERYYADYAMILFESDIHVLRPDKFS